MDATPAAFRAVLLPTSCEENVSQVRTSLSCSPEIVTTRHQRGVIARVIARIIFKDRSFAWTDERFVVYFDWRHESSTPTNQKCSSPRRYSMNAILYDSYYTIHVTPEESCSYASFETNNPFKSYRCVYGFA